MPMKLFFQGGKTRLPMVVADVQVYICELDQAVTPFADHCGCLKN